MSAEIPKITATSWPPTRATSAIAIMNKPYKHHGKCSFCRWTRGSRCTVQGGPIKNAHFWKFVTRDAGDPCIKLFSTLSRVRMMSWILLRLNSLCTIMVKPYCTKIIIRPLFNVDMLWRLYVFSDVLDFVGIVVISIFGCPYSRSWPCFPTVCLAGPPALHVRRRPVVHQ